MGTRESGVQVPKAVLKKNVNGELRNPTNFHDTWPRLENKKSSWKSAVLVHLYSTSNYWTLHFYGPFCMKNVLTGSLKRKLTRSDLVV